MAGGEYDGETSARKEEERRSSGGASSLCCAKVLGARYLGFIQRLR